MRKEHWAWLGIFLLVSVLIHLLIGWKSRSLGVGDGPPPPNGQLEITLEPPDQAMPARKPPAEKPPRPPQVALAPRHERRARRVLALRSHSRMIVRRAAPPAPRVAKIVEPRPRTVRINPGGFTRMRREMPVPLAPALAKVTPKHTVSPDTPAPDTMPRRMAALTPHVSHPLASLSAANPLESAVADNERPEAPTHTHEIQIARAQPDLISPAGGGSPAPTHVLGGHGGARGPVAPPDDLLWDGGGRGGKKLPRMAARLGGGGGLAFLSVHDPLGEVVPDETPGAGPGRLGGEGAGSGGGAGFGRLKGIGTSLNGRRFASLRGAAGTGLGAGRGSHRGTFAPGGGSGTGAETPGTGGAGLGYGTEHSIGFGSGFHPGVDGGLGGSGHSLLGGGGGGFQTALNRGIPFGDITGLLRGDPNGGGGGGGGPGGSGAGFGVGGGPGGGSESVRMVYLLDVSGSMRKRDKIGKAREALEKALSELKRGDSFNIICFDAQTYPFADALKRATRDNIAQAKSFIESIPLDQHPGTNMSQALQTALNFPRVTHIFMMSDGEPQWGGITNFDDLRRFVVDQNTKKVPIFTLALGIGERFKGMALMRGIAEDNHGQFHYINLGGDVPTADGL